MRKQCLENRPSSLQTQGGHAREGVHVDSNEARAGTGSASRKNGDAGQSNAARGHDIVDLVGHLRLVVLVFHRTVVLIQDSQAQIHLGNLCVNGPKEHSVPAANHGLVIVERIPREGNAWPDVLVVGIERQILRIDLVPCAVVQREIARHFPGILEIQ